MRFKIHLRNTLKNQFIWYYVFSHGQVAPVDVPNMTTINLGNIQSYLKTVDDSNKEADSRGRYAYLWKNITESRVSRLCYL